MTKKYKITCAPGTAALYLAWEFGIKSAVLDMKHFSRDAEKGDWDLTKFLSLFGAKKDKQSGELFFQTRKEAENIRRRIETQVSYLRGKLGLPNDTTVYVDSY